jgi:signal transduction histidine kinase
VKDAARGAILLLARYGPGLLLIAAMWASLAIWISWDRSVELRAAAQASATLVETLAEHSRQVMGEAEQTAAMVALEVSAHGLDIGLAEWERRGLINDRAFVQVAVVDARGILRDSTLADFQPIDVSDREHVRAQIAGPRAADVRQLYIGRPVVGRTSGRPSVQLSRAILDGDGKLIGVAVVSLDPSYFTGLYKLLRIGEHGMVSVVGTRDFVVRAHRTRVGESLGDELSPHSALRAALGHASAGTFSAAGPMDGAERITSYRVLDRYPLAVVVGFSTLDYLQSFRRRRDLLLLTGAFMTALIAFAEIRRVSLWGKLAASARREHIARQQEAERAASLQALIKAIPDAVIAFSDGVVRGMNPRLGEMLGLENEPLTDWTPERLADMVFANDLSDDQSQKRAELTRALQHQASGASRRLVFTLKTPRVRVLEFRIESLRDPYDGVVALVRDVTAETQVDRMKTEFVATAAHELRTPTAGILGLSELLAADRVPQGRKQSIYGMIRDQAKSLSTLVSDLLDLARIEARADKDFKMAEFNALDVVHSAIDRLPGIRERVALQAAQPHVLINGDFTQLETVVRNLLENCVKYSAPDTPIRISAEKVGAMFRLTVEDEGIGIAQGEQAKVFDRFYRVDKNGAVPGSGLGLALVREIVQLHGGKVSLESQPGVGTKVSISIPAEA